MSGLGYTVQIWGITGLRLGVYCQDWGSHSGDIAIGLGVYCQNWGHETPNSADLHPSTRILVLITPQPQSNPAAVYPTPCPTPCPCPWWSRSGRQIHLYQAYRTSYFRTQTCSRRALRWMQLTGAARGRSRGCRDGAWWCDQVTVLSASGVTEVIYGDTCGVTRLRLRLRLRDCGYTMAVHDICMGGYMPCDCVIVATRWLCSHGYI